MAMPMSHRSARAGGVLPPTHGRERQVRPDLGHDDMVTRCRSGTFLYSRMDKMTCPSVLVPRGRLRLSTRFERKNRERMPVITGLQSRTTPTVRW
jgi:hypothetical protein